MTPMSRHWTEEKVDAFLFRVSSDFVLQLEHLMEKTDTRQRELAAKLGVTKGRVSQVLNNPGNLTLRKMIEYSRALGCKVAVIAYDDGDPHNTNGPIRPQIFAACWEKAGRPIDAFDLGAAADTATTDALWANPGRFADPPSAYAREESAATKADGFQLVNGAR